MEAEGSDDLAAPVVFSLVSGLMSGGPGSPLPLRTFIEGRMRPWPRYLLRTPSSQSRPAVSRSTFRTWLAVQSGWRDQTRAAEAEAMAVAALVPLAPSQ
ncbi:hypothetical protein SBADM41S_03210 [Streptomyces badius]